MNTNNYEKIRKDLTNQLEINSSKIKELESKINILRINTTKNKIQNILLISIIPTIIYLLISPILITSKIPLIVLKYIPLTLSILIGVISEKIIEKKSHHQNKFSKSKKEIDKIEEQAKYEIELEKLINRNKVLTNTIETIEDNNISSKRNYNLENELQKLDIISTQNSLRKSFHRIRNKYQKLYLNISIPLIFSCIVTFLINYPTLVLYGTISISELLIPLLISEVISNIFISKEEKQYKKVWNKLKGNSLADIEEDNEEENISTSIDRQIEKVSKIEKQVLLEKSSTNIDISKKNTTYSPSKLNNDYNLGYLNQETRPKTLKRVLNNNNEKIK